jgi:hypothetical protein
VTGGVALAATKNRKHYDQLVRRRTLQLARNSRWKALDSPTGSIEPAEPIALGLTLLELRARQLSFLQEPLLFVAFTGARTLAASKRRRLKRTRKPQRFDGGHVRTPLHLALAFHAREHLVDKLLRCQLTSTTAMAAMTTSRLQCVDKVVDAHANLPPGSVSSKSTVSNPFSDCCRRDPRVLACFRRGHVWARWNLRARDDPGELYIQLSTHDLRDPGAHTSSKIWRDVDVAHPAPALVSATPTEEISMKIMDRMVSSSTSPSFYETRPFRGTECERRVR